MRLIAKRLIAKRLNKLGVHFQYRLKIDATGYESSANIHPDVKEET